MHPALIKKHKDKIKNIFNYDEEVIEHFDCMNRDRYYDLMEFLTKGLKKDVNNIYLSKWKELDFIEWKIFVDNNPLITIFTTKFVDNKIILSAKLTDLHEEYGFK